MSMEGYVKVVSKQAGKQQADFNAMKLAWDQIYNDPELSRNRAKRQERATTTAAASASRGGAKVMPAPLLQPTM